MLSESLYILRPIITEDVYFVKQLLFKKVFFSLIIFTDGCFLALKPDSGTKKQVSESNSNLMPLVSRIIGWAFIGARSPYVIGKRSSDWLKIKVAHTADFEVIGCVPMRGEKAITV